MSYLNVLSQTIAGNPGNQTQLSSLLQHPFSELNKLLNITLAFCSVYAMGRNDLCDLMRRVVLLVFKAITH